MAKCQNLVSYPPADSPTEMPIRHQRQQATTELEYEAAFFMTRKYTTPGCRCQEEKKRRLLIRGATNYKEIPSFRLLLTLPEGRFAYIIPELLEFFTYRKPINPVAEVHHLSLTNLHMVHLMPVDVRRGTSELKALLHHHAGGTLWTRPLKVQVLQSCNTH